MSQYIGRIDPEDVRFLMDLSEFKEFVTDMLGGARGLVNVEIDYEIIEEQAGDTLIRPMVLLNEISRFTEEDRHTLLSSGFSIDREPYKNGDYAMEQIFGTYYTILEATEDEDGAFFTIELPYHHFIIERNKD
ncbi:hypothetical protein [Halobacillus litoralis]|uniref:Uncharacterized protein n=1 Tax=Halobacillus litoralis TaxID=45668 RepID=A0A410MBA8_9BACI|nr:hypothetical protein [Halobacillus litoralis]QAS51963.1 hypothetical protein HLI_06885 [Halobacillus litoralis]